MNRAAYLLGVALGYPAGLALAVADYHLALIQTVKKEIPA